MAAARRVRSRAHAPYSGFRVGAALRTRRGQVFAGCNVENASLGAGICAERSAVLQAVAHGMRPGDLEAVAVYTGDRRLTPPCGMCLQVLVEFGRSRTTYYEKLRRFREGGGTAPRIGYLVGARDVRFYQTRLPVGETLRASVRLAGIALPLCTYAFEVARGEDALASGTLSTWLTATGA